MRLVYGSFIHFVFLCVICQVLVSDLLWFYKKKIESQDPGKKHSPKII